jgi:hypothetical protein
VKLIAHFLCAGSLPRMSVNLQHVTQQFQTDIADLLFRAAFERMSAHMCQRPALVSVVAEIQGVTSAAKETSISNQIEENFAQILERQDEESRKNEEKKHGKTLKQHKAS